MVDPDARSLAKIGEALALFWVELKSDVLNSGQSVCFHLLWIEPSGHGLLVVQAQDQRDVLIDADQAVERCTDRFAIGDVDKQRGRQPAARWDLLWGADALDPEHLLDLETDGFPVLEHQRDVLADGDATRPLVRDDGGSIRAAQARVSGVVDDVF
jgi:hypothetical protein